MNRIMAALRGVAGNIELARKANKAADRYLRLSVAESHTEALLVAIKAEKEVIIKEGGDNSGK